LRLALDLVFRRSQWSLRSIREDSIDRWTIAGETRNASRLLQSIPGCPQNRGPCRKTTVLPLKRHALAEGSEKEREWAFGPDNNCVYWAQRDGQAYRHDQKPSSLRRCLACAFGGDEVQQVAPTRILTLPLEPMSIVTCGDAP
jgi:hypothetical protein